MQKSVFNGGTFRRKFQLRNFQLDETALPSRQPLVEHITEPYYDISLRSYLLRR